MALLQGLATCDWRRGWDADTDTMVHWKLTLLNGIDIYDLQRAELVETSKASHLRVAPKLLSYGCRRYSEVNDRACAKNKSQTTTAFVLVAHSSHKNSLVTHIQPKSHHYLMTSNLELLREPYSTWNPSNLLQVQQVLFEHFKWIFKPTTYVHECH